VFRIFHELRRRGFVRRGRPAPTAARGGRRPHLWEFNARNAFAVGAEFSASGVTAAVVDLNNEPVHVERAAFASLDRDRVMADGDHPTGDRPLRRARGRLQGLGIGVPAWVDIAP